MNRMNYDYIPYSKKFGASVMVLMLLVGFVLVGIPFQILPKAAATTVPTLTLSHSDIDELLPNVMRIHFDDPDLRLNDSPRPSMTIAIPSTAAGAERLLVPSQLVDGSWVVYLTSASGSCLVPVVGSCGADDIGADDVGVVLATCADVGNTLYGTDCGLTAGGEGVVVVLGGVIDTFLGNSGLMAYPGASDFADFVANPGLLIPGRTNQENEHFVHVADWTNEEITIRAFGASTTETATFDGEYADHSITNDKTSISPAAMLRLNIAAVTMDNDPTAVDTFPILAAALDHDVVFTSGGNLIVGALDATTTDLAFTEDGVNDQTFSIDTPFDMSTLEQGTVTVTTLTTTNWANGDDYSIGFLVGDGSLNLESQTLSISIAQGSLSLDASGFTFRTPMTITINDNDRNLDSEAEDTIQLDVTATFDDGTETTTQVVATETDDDTGIFEAELEATIAAASLLLIAGDELSVMPGDHPNMLWRYTDSYSTNALPGNTASDSAGLLTTQAAIALDKTGYGPQEPTAVLTIIEPDANDDDEARESLTLESIGVGGGTVDHDSGVTIADFDVTRIRNAIETVRDFGPAITREDADDDGFWTISIDLQAMDLGLESGDVLQVCYNDRFDDAEVCASASIGGSVAQISFDRPVGSIPIAPGQTVTTCIAPSRRCISTVTVSTAWVSKFWSSAVSVTSTGVPIFLSPRGSGGKFTSMNASLAWIEISAETPLSTSGRSPRGIVSVGSVSSSGPSPSRTSTLSVPPIMF